MSFSIAGIADLLQISKAATTRSIARLGATLVNPDTDALHEGQESVLARCDLMHKEQKVCEQGRLIDADKKSLHTEHRSESSTSLRDATSSGQSSGNEMTSRISTMLFYVAFQV